MLKAITPTWLIIGLTLIYLFESILPTTQDVDTSEYSILSTAEVEPSFKQDILPYQRFRVLEDSLKRIEQYRKLINDGTYGTGGTFGLFGYREYSECDTCSPPKFTDAGPVKYYLQLTGYYLKDPATFFIENGKNMLRYPVWDSATVDKKTGDTTNKFGHYEVRVLNYRFTKENKNDAPINKGSVLIPVKKSTYEVIKKLVFISTALTWLLAIYPFVLVPIQLLVSVARGDDFKPWHFKKLYFIAAVAIAYTFLPVLLKYVLRFSFRDYLDNSVSLHFIDVLKSTSETLVTSIILLIIAKAFKKGYELQNEQEHTI